MSERVHIKVHHRKEPDLRRLARALIDLALREAEGAKTATGKSGESPQEEPG